MALDSSEPTAADVAKTQPAQSFQGNGFDPAIPADTVDTVASFSGRGFDPVNPDLNAATPMEFAPGQPD